MERGGDVAVLFLLVEDSNMNSTTRHIARETWRRASDAIANGETEGAEFLVWWERLAGLNQGWRDRGRGSD
jgi:hypothetical protein